MDAVSVAGVSLVKVWGPSVLGESPTEDVSDSSIPRTLVVAGVSAGWEVGGGSVLAAGPPRSSLKSLIFSGVTWLEIKTELTKIIEIPLPVQRIEMVKLVEEESASTC